MAESFTIELTKEEERLAQLLTRDAWGYFSSLISQREIFHVKEIPMMPRGGRFDIVDDAELIQYYLDSASAYGEELSLYGWESNQVDSIVESFVRKLEESSGLRRGMGAGTIGMAS